MSTKTYTELEQEVRFLKKVINTIPATVHVVELDEELNTLPVWTNVKYQELIGYSLDERQKLGFAGNNGQVYYSDDAKTVKENIQMLLDNPQSHVAIFFRVKHKSNSPKWIYLLGTKFHFLSSSKNYLLCLGIDVNQRLGTNDTLIDTYLKEITKLKNKLRLCQLTKTEQRVTQLYAGGLSTKEIATRLHRSYDTINNHKRHIFSKMGFHKVTELVHFAEECGLT